MDRNSHVASTRDRDELEPFGGAPNRRTDADRSSHRASAGGVVAPRQVERCDPDEFHHPPRPGEHARTHAGLIHPRSSIGTTSVAATAHPQLTPPAGTAPWSGANGHRTRAHRGE